MFDVFLAHNSKDKPQVRTIANELRKRGLNPWLDEEQMYGGDTPLEEIQKGLSQSKSVAFFIGLDGSGNWQGNLELPITVNLVLHYRLRLIPVLLPGVQEIPKNPQYFFLSTKIWVSFESNDDADALNRLEKSIRKQIKAEEIKPEQKEAENKPKVTESVSESKPIVETKSPLTSPQIPPLSFQVFEFEVVKVEVEVQSSGLFGLGSKIILYNNRSRSQAQYFSENLGNGVTLDMVAIPEGKFMMGSPSDEKNSYDDERPQHEVTVQPFFMGKYPVTQAQWKAIASLPKVECDLDPNPARFKNRDNSDRRPVEQVSWEDAVEFCQRLSQQTEKTYRLPTEAEWEYACRADTTTPFHFGETITTDLVNYDGNYPFKKIFCII